MKNKAYYAAFGTVPGIDFDSWQIITSKFPSIEKAWEKNESDYLLAGLSDKFVKNLVSTKKKIKPVEVYENLKKHQIDIITLLDPDYPENLKEIYKPPFLLYIKGNLRSSDKSSIAVVGARKCTNYGIRVTRDIAKDLAREKITVVSGLALGLDTEAHYGALDGMGRTIAVCAHGLDMIYPRSNTVLFEKITKNGAVISEYPPGTYPKKEHFPGRNRIISGLSLGVLVTEATDKSGTLHTVKFGVEQNRNIYTIPGSIYNPMSQTPNRLICEGAKPVLEIADILEDFEYADTIAKEYNREEDGKYNK